MKKLLLLLSLLIWTLILVGQSKWSFGASLQAGFSGYSSSDYQDYSDHAFGGYTYKEEEKLQPSVGGGLWLERRLAERWGIYLGLDYLQANSFSRVESTSYNNLTGGMNYFSQNDNSTRQQQLQLPLEIHFYLGHADHSWRPFISVGTQLQYLLSQINTTDNFYGTAGEPTSESSYSHKMNLKDNYQDYSRWQMGFNAGIGLASDRISLSLRHTRTASKPNDDYYYCDCYCGVGTNSYCDHVYYGDSRNFRQLQQTSLRFQYRL